MFSETLADSIPAILTVADPAVSNCPCEPQQAVGAVPQHQIEAELDQVIKQLGARSVRAMNDGDPQGAAMFRDRMYAAIASRTPEHRNRLEAEILRQIDDGAGYFAYQGQLAAELLAKQEA